MSNTFSPANPFCVKKWSPSEELLKNNIFAVIGCAGNGKTTIIKHFHTNSLDAIEILGNQLKNAPKADGERMQALSFQSFTEMHPAIRNQIDYIILCGLPSRQDVARIHDRYQHLFDFDLSFFQQVIDNSIHSYNCLIIDISREVRLGNEKASFYWCRAKIE